MEELTSQGKKRVLVVSPAFVSDCLETLEELELDNRNVFMSNGGDRCDAVPCLNDSDSFIRVLHSIAVEA